MCSDLPVQRRVTEQSRHLSEAVICLPTPGNLQEFLGFLQTSWYLLPLENIFITFPMLHFQLQPQICTGTRESVSKSSEGQPEQYISALTGAGHPKHHHSHGTPKEEEWEPMQPLFLSQGHTGPLWLSSALDHCVVKPSNPKHIKKHAENIYNI